MPSASIRVAVAHVERVRLDDRTFRNVLLEGFDHVARQNVRAVPFARVELDRDLPDDFAVHERVELFEVFGVDLARKVDLRLFAAEVGTDAAAAHDRGLREFAVGGLDGAMVFVAAAGHVLFSFHVHIRPFRSKETFSTFQYAPARAGKPCGFLPRLARSHRKALERGMRSSGLRPGFLGSGRIGSALIRLGLGAPFRPKRRDPLDEKTDEKGGDDRPLAHPGDVPETDEAEHRR